MERPRREIRRKPSRFCSSSSNNSPQQQQQPGNDGGGGEEQQKHDEMAAASSTAHQQQQSRTKKGLPQDQSLNDKERRGRVVAGGAASCSSSSILNQQQQHEEHSDILIDGSRFCCDHCGSDHLSQQMRGKKRNRHSTLVHPNVRTDGGKHVILCNACVSTFDRQQKAARTRLAKPPVMMNWADNENEAALEDIEIFTSSLTRQLGNPDAQIIVCRRVKRQPCMCVQKYLTASPEHLLVNANMLIGFAMESKRLQGQKVTNRTKPKRGKGVGLGNGHKRSKEYEEFVLRNRKLLREELNICETTTQRILGYSNNFLHKKLKTEKRSRVAPQKTKSLIPLSTLCQTRCCGDKCVNLSRTHTNLVSRWRQQALINQKSTQRVIAEMLTPSAGGKTNCYRFVSMVCGCGSATISKVVTQLRENKGVLNDQEHGLVSVWKSKLGGDNSNADQTQSSGPAVQAEQIEKKSALGTDRTDDTENLKAEVLRQQKLITEQQEELTRLKQSIAVASPDKIISTVSGSSVSGSSVSGSSVSGSSVSVTDKHRRPPGIMLPRTSHSYQQPDYSKPITDTNTQRSSCGLTSQHEHRMRDKSASGVDNSHMISRLGGKTATVWSNSQPQFLPSATYNPIMHHHPSAQPVQGFYPSSRMLPPDLYAQLPDAQTNMSAPNVNIGFLHPFIDSAMAASHWAMPTEGQAWRRPVSSVDKTDDLLYHQDYRTLQITVVMPKSVHFSITGAGKAIAKEDSPVHITVPTPARPSSSKAIASQNPPNHETVPPSRPRSGKGATTQNSIPPPVANIDSATENSGGAQTIAKKRNDYWREAGRRTKLKLHFANKRSNRAKAYEDLDFSKIDAPIHQLKYERWLCQENESTDHTDEQTDTDGVTSPDPEIIPQVDTNFLKRWGQTAHAVMRSPEINRKRQSKMNEREIYSTDHSKYLERKIQRVRMQTQRLVAERRRKQEQTERRLRKLGHNDYEVDVEKANTVSGTSYDQISTLNLAGSSPVNNSAPHILSVHDSTESLCHIDDNNIETWVASDSINQDFSQEQKDKQIRKDGSEVIGEVKDILTGVVINRVSANGIDPDRSHTRVVSCQEFLNHIEAVVEDVHEAIDEAEILKDCNNAVPRAESLLKSVNKLSRNVQKLENRVTEGQIVDSSMYRERDALHHDLADKNSFMQRPVLMRPKDFEVIPQYALEDALWEKDWDHMVNDFYTLKAMISGTIEETDVFDKKVIVFDLPHGKCPVSWREIFSMARFQLKELVCYPFANDRQIKWIMMLENKNIYGLWQSNLMKRIKNKLQDIKNNVRVTLADRHALEQMMKRGVINKPIFSTQPAALVSPRGSSVNERQKIRGELRRQTIVEESEPRLYAMSRHKRNWAKYSKEIMQLGMYEKPEFITALAKVKDRDFTRKKLQSIQTQRMRFNRLLNFELYKSGPELSGDRTGTLSISSSEVSLEERDVSCSLSAYMVKQFKLLGTLVLDRATDTSRYLILSKFLKSGFNGTDLLDRRCFCTDLDVGTSQSIASLRSGRRRRQCRDTVCHKSDEDLCDILERRTDPTLFNELVQQLRLLSNSDLLKVSQAVETKKSAYSSTSTRLKNTEESLTTTTTANSILTECLDGSSVKDVSQIEPIITEKDIPSNCLDSISQQDYVMTGHVLKTGLNSDPQRQVYKTTGKIINSKYVLPPIGTNRKPDTGKTTPDLNPCVTAFRLKVEKTPSANHVVVDGLPPPTYGRRLVPASVIRHITTPLAPSDSKKRHNKTKSNKGGDNSRKKKLPRQSRDMIGQNLDHSWHRASFPSRTSRGETDLYKLSVALPSLKSNTENRNIHSERTNTQLSFPTMWTNPATSLASHSTESSEVRGYNTINTRSHIPTEQR